MKEGYVSLTIVGVHQTFAGEYCTFFALCLEIKILNSFMLKKIK